MTSHHAIPDPKPTTCWADTQGTTWPNEADAKASNARLLFLAGLSHETSLDEDEQDEVWQTLIRHPQLIHAAAFAAGTLVDRRS